MTKAVVPLLWNGGDISPTLRSQTHGNLPVVALGQLTSKANGTTLKPVQPTLCGAGNPHIVCMASGQGNELDFCVLSAGFRYKAGSAAGSVGYQEETAPTLIAGQQSSVLKAYGIGSYHSPGCNQGGIAIVGVDGGWQGWELTVRRLTPLECERLQGFPDGWTEYGSDGRPICDTSRYQMLGNSVAVPCVAYIMQGMALALERSVMDCAGRY